MSARSCDQLCPIRDMYTDHQGTDDKCALMISVVPAVPAVSAHQCQLSVLINATCQCLPVHINATYQCPYELPFSATYQCQSVPPISASQCHLYISVHLSCLSVSPISASQCRPSV
ncbi:unnamed protein product, partial [Staurois parvus]